MSYVRSAVLAGVLAFGALSASADPSVTVTAGSERILTDGLAGDQSAPGLALGAGGAFLVWQDNSVHTSGLRVRAQKFDGALTAGAAPLDGSVIATKTTTGDQENAQVVALDNGGAALVWQGGYRGKQAIYARILGSNGVFATKDIKVNSYGKNYQITPSVTKLADGNLVVVWASLGQDGSLLGVFGQRLSPTGAKLGKEFQVNQTTLFNQRTPSVAALKNGGFVVVWISELQRGEASVDVYSRIYDASGVATNGEFALNPAANHVCANPVAVGLPNGGFVVAWSQNDDPVRGSGGSVSDIVGVRSTNSWDIVGCFFDANGLAGTPARLNTYTYGDQYAPKLAVSGDRCLAVWTSLGQDGSREGLFGQFLALNGDRVGEEFGVNATTVSRQIQPSVAVDGAGNFSVVWSSFRGGLRGFDIYARSFQASAAQ